MTDINARAGRLNAIVAAVSGKVIDRKGNVVQIEIPAAAIRSAITRLGAAGFSATILQRPAVYQYSIDLSPHSEAQPHAIRSTSTAAAAHRSKSAPPNIRSERPG